MASRDPCMFSSASTTAGREQTILKFCCSLAVGELGRQEGGRQTTPAGLEPTTSRSVDGCAGHCATGPMRAIQKLVTTAPSIAFSARRPGDCRHRKVSLSKLSAPRRPKTRAANDPGSARTCNLPLRRRVRYPLRHGAGESKPVQPIRRLAPLRMSRLKKRRPSNPLCSTS